MKFFIHLAAACFLMISCTTKGTKPKNNSNGPQEIINPSFQNILDSAAVKGAILIFDTHQNRYYSNDFIWSKTGRLPASTFKIPNSIIGLETNMIESDNMIFKWDGRKRNMSIWEKDLTLREAFHLSCVPCYQKVARDIGLKRMNTYLDTLDYKEMIVNNNTLDIFWLEGGSKISQFEQIDFLKRFYLSELSISNRTHEIIKKLMVIEENDEFILSGKTGWSVRNGNNNGWFVGYLEVDEHVFFFATNINPTEYLDINRFAAIRKDVTLKAFRSIHIIP